MANDEPEKLWASVVGDTEPWRRGRLFLVLLAVCQVLTHLLTIGSQLLIGNVELLLAISVGAIAFWLSFYFIWIGVHWVRWLCGGFSCLLGFAKLIWGWRDGSSLLLIDGTISLVTGAYLGFAPSVYFFALRQKETVRWKETLAVAAVFALLLTSACVTMAGLSTYKGQLEQRGREFADQVFRRVFMEGDSAFLKTHVTDRLLQEAGWERLSRLVGSRYMQTGEARDLQPSQGRLRFWLRLPFTLVAEGVMSTQANTEKGPVVFHLRIGGTRGEWQIDAIGGDPSRRPTLLLRERVGARDLSPSIAAACLPAYLSCPWKMPSSHFGNAQSSSCAKGRSGVTSSARPFPTPAPGCRSWRKDGS